MTDVHPDAQAILDSLRTDPAFPPAYTLSPQGARDALNNLLAGDEGEPISVGETADLTLDGPHGDLPVRCYVPDGEGPHPTLLYFHGGGWVRGGVDTHDDLLRALCRDGDLLVVGVDYGRAPENSFPGPLDEAYAALQWAAAHVDQVGGDPERLAVAGDSAGGNLAAATAIRARDENGPEVRHQALLYPITDYAFDTESYAEHADNDLLPRETMQWYWDQYLDRELDGRHPYASVLRAPDLADLPAATVVTAEHDVLRSEGKAYADRLREAGVPVEYQNYDGMIHAFCNFGHLDVAQDARAFVAERISDALRS